MKSGPSALVRTSAICLFAAAIVLLVAATASAQLPTVTGDKFEINCPGATATTVTDINDAGVVVGRCIVNGKARGFRFTKGDTYDQSTGTFEWLDFSETGGTEAWGINNAGDVVGFYTLPGDPYSHGFLLHGSTGLYDTIDRGGALNTMPEDIDDAGYVVGCVHNNGLMIGFVWRDGHFLSVQPSNSMFTSVNESGTAIGYAFAPPDANESFIVSGVGTTSFMLPGTMNTQAWGLNQDGDIVGLYGAADGTARAFLRLHDGQLKQVIVPDATISRAYGINQAGTIVGAFGPARTCHGFVLVK